MNIWKAQARTAYSAGLIDVRRQGSSANVTVSAGRHLSAAVAGDWVLVAEVDGALWGLALLGTGPSAYPANPAVDGSTPASGTLIVPPAWTAMTTREYSTVAPVSAWTFGQERSSYAYWTGTELAWTLLFDRMHDALSVYLGLAGLTITAASVTVDSQTSTIASTTAKLALFKAPVSIPSSTSAITKLATVAAPTLPTSAPVTVALPATWLTQLSSGAANAIGMVDETRTTEHYVNPKTVAAPNLTVTYA